MRLARYHGLGNDYLVLEEGPALSPGLVRAVCDRHTGAGGDGILEPADAAGRDAGVRIWNPDGSVAEKSGNGLRIFARWLVDTGRVPDGPFTLWTGACAVGAEVGPERVVLEMGQASFDPADVPVHAAAPLVDAPLEVGAQVLRVTAVGLGNPHAVIFVDAPLDDVPWRSWGALLETDARFPRRTNVQVARVVGDGVIALRVWERGAGPTLASGSSACAVAAAAVRTGRLPFGTHLLQMPGGEVGVTVRRDYALVLRGAVERIGLVDLDAVWVAARVSRAAGGDPPAGPETGALGGGLSS
ncbi:MAG: diaminopimelate epimerase [Alphaproteobacteria bacterium]|nr:diaminopimelate epimerase [Alphaproteobacteria bacterium]